MRALFAAVILSTVSIGTSASAADLPAYKAPPVITPAFSWTGFYIGANAGYSWGKASGDVAAFGVTANGDENLNGAIAGGQIGFNWQTGNLVFGLEADGQWSGQKFSSSASSGGITVTEDDKIQWFATFRGRFGYAADRWLFYVTGGGAYAGFESAIGVTGLGTATWQTEHAGWTVGAGLENAITNNWSWKLEYLYLDTGSFSTTFFGVVPGHFKLQDNIVRVGLNYRF